MYSHLATRISRRLLSRPLSTINIISKFDFNPVAQIQRGTSPQRDPYAINQLVALCARSGDVDCGIHLHCAVVKLGFGSNVYICSALVDMYAKCGRLVCARKMFDEMPVRNSVAWNVLINGYVQAMCPEIGLELFRKMMKGGVAPTTFGVSGVLVGSAQLEDDELGAQVHGLGVKYGICDDVVVDTSLVDMYAKCLKVEESKRLFDQMSERNSITWTAMVTGYAHNGLPLEAMTLFKEMQQLGFESNYVTYNGLLSSFYSRENLMHCKQIHGLVVRQGLDSNSYIQATLLSVYSECDIEKGDFISICSFVSRWDQISFNAAIAGLSQLECSEEALHYFSSMRASGIMADYFTLSSILRAIGIISAQEAGKQTHSGRASHGCGQEVIELFEQMKSTGIRPNGTTILSVLSACSHVGLLEKGLEYLVLFRGLDFHESLTPEHCASIVDLFGRAGYLQEAEAFISSMPMKPGPSILKSLVSACKLHGNTEIAMRASQKLLELYPNDPGTYVLMSSSLATGGFWGEAAGLIKQMQDKGVQKKPGARNNREKQAMAELDRVRHGEGVKTPKTPTSATAAQMLLESPSSLSSTHSPSFGKNHDLDNDHSHHHKKTSVLVKVKDKAKRWQQALMRKKHTNPTPSRGVALEDDTDEDPEYNGAPMYESEVAPDSYKEHAKQHPRADNVIPEKHVLDNSAKTQTAGKMLAEDKKGQPGSSKNIIAEEKKETPSSPAKGTIVEGKVVAEEEKQKLSSPDGAILDEGNRNIYGTGKTITETVTEKLAPAYATMSEAAHAITSKIHGMASSISSSPTKRAMAEEQGNPAGSYEGNIVSAEEKQKLPSAEEVIADEEKGPVPSSGKTITETVTEKLAPAYATVSDAAHAITSKIQGMASSIPSSSGKKTMAGEQGNLAGSCEGHIVSAEDKQKLPSLEESIADEKKGPVPSSGKTMTETVTEKFAPAYATVSGAAHAITSKIQGMPSSIPCSPPKKTLAEEQGNPVLSREDEIVSVKENEKLPSLEEAIADKEIQEKDTVASPGKTITETVSEKFAPAYATVSDATHAITSKIQEMSNSMLTDDSGGINTRNWDKGVSVKEYIKNKLEPGENDKALSQVISDAISPKKNPDDKGVMEKVKDAVTSMLQSEEEETAASSLKNSSSAELIPLSTSAHE
ncbi:Pentatricopeptide repeat-containing protein, partial [Drosera capensis]